MLDTFQVTPANAVDMVDQLKAKVGVGGVDGWQGLAQVWATIDVGASIAAGVSAPAGRGSVSSTATRGEATANAMRISLQAEIGDCTATRNNPLTSFEVARLLVGLLHLGWVPGHRDRNFWIRLAYLRELGFRRRRTSKDLSSLVTSGSTRKE